MVAASTLSSTTSTCSGRDAGARARLVSPGPAVAGARARFHAGEAHDDLAAPARAVAERSNRPAVQLDQAAYHREADADSALGAVQRARVLHEQVEGPLEQVGRHPDAPVAHPHDRLAILDRCLDLDRAAGARVLRGVVQQVAEHLDQARRIGVDEDRAAGAGHREPLRPLRHERPADLDGPLDDRREIEHLPAQRDLPLAHARDVEQVVEQPLHVPDLPPDHLAGHRRGLGVVRGQAEDLDGAEDGRHGIAQLVRQHRQEFVLAPIGLLQLRERAGPFAFQLPAMGVVGDDRHAAVHAAPRVPGRRDDEVHPAPAQPRG